MLPDADRPVRRALHRNAAGPEGVGVRILEKGSSVMAKADSNGSYSTVDEQGNTHYFVVRKGDTIPDGAAFQADPEENVGQPADEAAAEEQAPKASTKAVGPSETTKAAGPSQKG